MHLFGSKNLFAEEADRVLVHMSDLDPSSEGYSSAVKNLEILAKAEFTKDHLSKDSILAATTSVGGIVAILQYERLNVITTKAFSLLTKVRL